MSHELRTPLNGIMGCARLLHMEGGLTAVQSSRVDVMLSAGPHLLELINSDLSQIEAGRLGLKTSEIDPRTIAAACLDLIRPAAEAKKLALSVTTAPDVPLRIVVVATRLRQVLLNLMGNAVKFTARGSVELRLRTTAQGTGLRLEVADTGPGILIEHRQQLFHAFGRLGAEASGIVEGAGLGLALSSGLATLMGGCLGQEANPDGGSLFWLDLPLTSRTGRPVPSAFSYPATQPETSEIVNLQGRSLRVLIVDDIAMNRDIASSFLRVAGHEVNCSEDGAEAVEAVASSNFDVVLMDVRMPGMDGLEATRRIRAFAAPRGRVQIVALTAHFCRAGTGVPPGRNGRSSGQTLHP